MITTGLIRRLVSAAAAAVMFATASGAAAQSESLPLDSKLWAPTITSKSGIGTANARVEAKATRQDIASWCANWRPEDKACVQQTLATPEAQKTYRASADCTRGLITPADGNTYTVAGKWDNTDIGGGQTRWRDSSGKIVGRDNASGGLSISQQWEVLCPGPVNAAQAGSAGILAAGSGQRPAVPAGQRQAAPPTLSGPPVCGTRPFCTETSSFGAVVSDFQAILQNTNDKTLTVRLSFKNKLNRPLILGYVSGSGIATDDRGNRYVPSGERAVQGIGLVQGTSTDPKFILQPGEAGVARFELVWHTSGQEVFGLSFQLDLAIREVDQIAGNQLRLGREHALHFSGLANRAGTAAPAAPPATTTPIQPSVPSAPPSAAAAPQVDACAGRPRCYSAGPFAAEVIGLTPSVPNNMPSLHLLQARVRFRNLTNQNLIVAYVANSAVITDNYGGRYTIRTDSGYGDGAKGIGVVQRGNADPQFALAPGASGDATFTLSRIRVRNDPMGSTFSFDMTIAQLDVLPSQQIRTVREYSVGFSGLSGSAGSGTAPAASAAAAPLPAGTPASQVDACGGKPRCYSAGPFVAEITGLTGSVPNNATNIHMLQVKVRFRNLTDQPIALAYVADSAVIIDDHGSRYTIRNNSGYGDGAKGIGVVQRDTADPRFVLRAGASGDAAFTLSRILVRTERMGSTFNLDLAIAQLEALPSQQIRTIREYAVSVPNLTAGGGILNKILQGIPKKDLSK